MHLIIESDEAVVALASSMATLNLKDSLRQHSESRRCICVFWTALVCSFVCLLLWIIPPPLDENISRIATIRQKTPSSSRDRSPGAARTASGATRRGASLLVALRPSVPPILPYSTDRRLVSSLFAARHMDHDDFTTTGVHAVVDHQHPHAAVFSGDLRPGDVSRKIVNKPVVQPLRQDGNGSAARRPAAAAATTAATHEATHPAHRRLPFRPWAWYEDADPRTAAEHEHQEIALDGETGERLMIHEMIAESTAIVEDLKKRIVSGQIRARPSVEALLKAYDQASKRNPLHKSVGGKDLVAILKEFVPVPSPQTPMPMESSGDRLHRLQAIIARRRDAASNNNNNNVGGAHLNAIPEPVRSARPRRQQMKIMGKVFEFFKT